MNQYLQHLVQNIPREPGVYKMKNATGDIIYIGKAKDLKNRVGSYFQLRADKNTRTLKMVEQIADIDYTVVSSQLEALILETNLIKELRPKYNILMKDDKNFVYIKITVHEPYPRVYLVRKPVNDKSLYFGPKTALHKVVKTIKLLKSIFPFRHCQLAFDYSVRGEKKSSMRLTPKNLEYHKKHCLGLCITSISQEEYRSIIEHLIRFFEGQHEQIIEKIKEDMLKAASEKKFEFAANIRDKLRALEEVIEPQRISDPHQKDLDVINYVQEDDKLYFNLFQLRNGKFIGQENFLLKSSDSAGLSESESLSSFLEQYYEKTSDIPQEILIPHQIEDRETIAAWLGKIKGRKVDVLVPERGKKNHFLEFSLANAQSFAKQSRIKWQGEEKPDRTQALLDLQNLLHLPKIPRRMECYDVSHLSGTATVSSMVVFENGFPKKSDYRKFKLHQERLGAPNDVASIEETLTRRLKYLKPSNKEKPTDVGNRHACSLHLYAGKKLLLKSLKIADTTNIPIFIKKILKKYKLKRLYIACNTKEQAKYEEFGFQGVHKAPAVFPPLKRQIYLVYDDTKYKEDASFSKRPDLIVIDGGKGQLSAGQKALKGFVGNKNFCSLQNLPMISLAKREEEIFLPDQRHPLRLPKNSPVLHLIQHIRDEAHRFALSYHHNLRRRNP